SHSIAQKRIAELDFNSGIFTNFSPDHLDYHRDLEEYFQTKRSFLQSLPEKGQAILNIDDKRYEEIVEGMKAKVFSYGVKRQGDIFLKRHSVDLSLKGMKFLVCVKDEEYLVESSLIGEYNIYNILCAICFCLSEGFSPKAIVPLLKEFSGVPGRLERIECGQDFLVFVDYAHTEDALRNVLRTMRSILPAGGRLISIFGCGGDRDRQKRPVMGKVGSELSDLLILTSDNPRTEDPEEILKEVAKGIERRDNYQIILDRREAIRKGIEVARTGDVVVIAGKGHEKYQVFKDTIIPFDDREVVREEIKALLRRR
ncbi:MAG: UDP-N-acetylmuramoyl-L-alanyl-D-glutamate--2,6-diaminopimelate ligase, partial [Candidatus Omnitrophota bacterium]